VEEFVAEGERRRVFEGCRFGAATQWERVHVAAEPGAAGSVEVAVRHATDREGLAAREFRVVGTVPEESSPFELDVSDGGVLEVRLVLRTAARDGAPRVRRIGVEWGCGGPE
jgi:hypothetical protein